MTEARPEKSSTAVAIDIAITLLIVFIILGYCLLILAPFLSLILWGGVIAIAIFPAYTKLADLLGQRPKSAAALIVLLGFAIVVIPLWVFTGSLIETALALKHDFSDGVISVPPPAETVRQWPIIGEQVYNGWSEASTNISEFLAEHGEQVRNLATTIITKIAGAGLEALQFLISIIIAAAFLINAERATTSLRTLFNRISARSGEELHKLTIATIRSVAVGVLGIAVIQSLLAGIGFVLVGLPAAGLWVLLVLILAIAQLPPLLILLPLAIYIFSVESTTIAVVFLIWSILVSSSDAVLKPLLLGRGVDAPMLVILLGAIGGMISFGIIGLFLGAVVLALGYRLFHTWVEAQNKRVGDGAAGSTGSAE